MCPQLLKIEHLVKHFSAKASMFYTESGALAKGSKVHALDGVSFSLDDNSTLGIVGESGCGKSTLARTILLLSRPTTGRVYFEGEDLTELGYRQLSKIRPRMQMVFQDPFSSLDPRMRARDIIAEPLKVVMGDGGQVKERVREVFEQVGLNAEHLGRFPNEFSGGQRQRIAIARAISTRPKLVVLDEPTSALDASTQAQILNLLKDIQQEYKISYLFISHNINVVRYMSNRIGVMYLGKVVEMGSTDAVLKSTKHPYSRALVSSIPQPDPRRRVAMVEIKGETPSSLAPPSGCRYNPRCPYMTEVCKETEPPLVEVEQQQGAHLVACHHPLDSQGAGERRSTRLSAG